MMLLAMFIIIEDISADTAIQELDLSSSTGLQHIQLSCPDRVLGMISWLPSVLARIPQSAQTFAHPTATTLRTLTISFKASQQFHLDRPFLMHIAHLLSRDMFRGLEEMRFKVHSLTRPSKCSGYTDIVKCVQDVLGKWVERGVLKIEFVVALEREDGEEC
jgi:hypothetical protein